MGKGRLWRQALGPWYLLLFLAAKISWKLYAYCPFLRKMDSSISDVSDCLRSSAPSTGHRGTVDLFGRLTSIFQSAKFSD